MITGKKTKKILLVFGTRPEAIKMAPLVKEFQKHPNQFVTKVCVTGQHREMLHQVLSLFEISPDYDLDVMKAGQDLYDITSRVLMGMRDVLEEAKPDLVFVHGDTTTSTTAALATFYQKIPVAHIEAGLRTNDKYSPWPEEMNRQITGRLASIHFAPTELSRSNLLNEGIPASSVYITGNTVIDALHWVISKLNQNSGLKHTILETLVAFGLKKEVVQSWAKNERKLILITGHRRENFGQGFINICEAIKELAVLYPEVDFVYPMHLNPNVRSAINEVFNYGKEADRLSENTLFIEPLEYLPFIYLLSVSYIVLTDSGGIQEEAPSLGKPVLVMRDTTERPEAVNAGTVKLVGTHKHNILTEVSKLIEDQDYYKERASAINPYGDGEACQRIVYSLKNNC
jgi:UDP-N-acetylglucosamine 2-epimerase (non-hydrolysing)